MLFRRHAVSPKTRKIVNWIGLALLCTAVAAVAAVVVIAFGNEIYQGSKPCHPQSSTHVELPTPQDSPVEVANRLVVAVNMGDWDSVEKMMTADNTQIQDDDDVKDPGYVRSICQITVTGPFEYEACDHGYDDDGNKITNVPGEEKCLFAPGEIALKQGIERFSDGQSPYMILRRDSANEPWKVSWIGDEG